jgi:hypothetical protein
MSPVIMTDKSKCRNDNYCKDLAPHTHCIDKQRYQLNKSPTCQDTEIKSTKIVYQDLTTAMSNSELPNSANELPNSANELPNSANELPNSANELPNSASDMPIYVNNFPNYVNDLPILTCELSNSINDIHHDSTNNKSNLNSDMPISSTEMNQNLRKQIVKKQPENCIDAEKEKNVINSNVNILDNVDTNDQDNLEDAEGASSDALYVRNADFTDNTTAQDHNTELKGIPVYDLVDKPNLNIDQLEDNSDTDVTTDETGQVWLTDIIKDQELEAKIQGTERDQELNEQNLLNVCTEHIETLLDINVQHDQNFCPTTITDSSETLIEIDATAPNEDQTSKFIPAYATNMDEFHSSTNTNEGTFNDSSIQLDVTNATSNHNSNIAVIMPDVISNFNNENKCQLSVKESDIAKQSDKLNQFEVVNNEHRAAIESKIVLSNNLPIENEKGIFNDFAKEPIVETEVNFHQGMDVQIQTSVAKSNHSEIENKSVHVKLNNFATEKMFVEDESQVIVRLDQCMDVKEKTSTAVAKSNLNKITFSNNQPGQNAKAMSNDVAKDEPKVLVNVDQGIDFQEKKENSTTVANLFAPKPSFLKREFTFKVNSKLMKLFDALPKEIDLKFTTTGNKIKKGHFSGRFYSPVPVLKVHLDVRLVKRLASPKWAC